MDVGRRRFDRADPRRGALAAFDQAEPLELGNRAPHCRATDLELCAERRFARHCVSDLERAGAQVGHDSRDHFRVSLLHFFPFQ